MEFPEHGALSLSERRPSWLQQGGHYFFRLCSLSLSRKASNAITKLPKAISKPIIPINIKMYIRSSHWRHLPSYVFRQAGHWLGRLPPLSWVPYWNTITVRQEFQSDSLFMEYVESVSKSISKQSHGAKRKTEKPLFYRLFSPNVRYSNSIHITVSSLIFQSFSALFRP